MDNTNVAVDLERLTNKYNKLDDTRDMPNLFKKLLLSKDEMINDLRKTIEKLEQEKIDMSILYNEKIEQQKINHRMKLKLYHQQYKHNKNSVHISKSKEHIIE